MDSRHRSKIKIITWDECKDCKCPLNRYHEKNGCEKKKAETQERCWNCDRNAYHKNDWHCSQGKTKNI